MFTQYKKELKGLLYNMTGVVFIALVLIITGIFVSVINFYGANPMFEQTLDSAAFIFFLAVPILTMRSFAEEKNNRTDQLLYSLPVGMGKIVIGKYLAMVTIHAISTLVMCIYPLIFAGFVKIDFLSTYCGIFAFFLLGCALVAIGMFISTLTESQVISAVITFGAFITMYLMGVLRVLMPTSPVASLIGCFVIIVIICTVAYTTVKNLTFSLAMSIILAATVSVVYFIDSALFEGLIPNVLRNFALFDRMYIFVAYGIFDLSAVVYYLSVISLFVYLTVRKMDKKRIV